MELEKLIEHMRQEARGYRSGRTLGRAFADAEDVLDEAASALQQLQAENDRLKNERDAAVADLKRWKICATCKHYAPRGKKSNCRVKDAYLSGGNWDGCMDWDWRGQRKNKQVEM